MSSEEERLISPQASIEEDSADRAIRPLSLADYVGQQEVKEQMDIFINAARGRGESPTQAPRLSLSPHPVPGQ